METRREIDVSSLAAKPKWWVTTVTSWSAVTILIAGFTVALGGAVALGDEVTTLTKVLTFARYFLSSSFWALIFLATSFAFDKLDELVWLSASEADRREIMRRRGRRGPGRTYG
jgi:hypothetical protein